MKKLLMTIAVVMLLAVPAMAGDPLPQNKSVNVLLTVDDYVTLNVPASVTVTVTAGSSMSVRTRVPDVAIYTNVPVTVQAEIDAIGSPVGTWVCDMWDYVAGAQTAQAATASANYPAGQDMDPGIFVQVSDVSNMASQTATKDATLTVTISKT